MDKIENTSGIPPDEFQRAGLIDRLSQYLAAEPKAWHVRYNLALALNADGQPEQALKQFRLVLKDSPKHLESLINIGGIHLSRGEADLALKAFTDALSAWDVPLVRANLAVAYLQLGHLDQAEKELNRALAQNPQMVEAWTNLGSTLMRMGRLKESIEASKKALEIMPDFAMAHNNLAAAFLEQRDRDKAREHALKARELGYPVPKEMLGELKLQGK
jgi:tetratricopeptide (TPR) repeat protein